MKEGWDRKSLRLGCSVGQPEGKLQSKVGFKKEFRDGQKWPGLSTPAIAVIGGAAGEDQVLDWKAMGLQEVLGPLLMALLMHALPPLPPLLFFLCPQRPSHPQPSSFTEGYWILSSAFSASIEIITCYLPFILLRWCITFIEFWMLNQLCVPSYKSHLVMASNPLFMFPGSGSW